MRTSQIFNSANTLLPFVNTGFRTINPGDAVLLGFDGNVSAPTYKANFPSTSITGAIFTKRPTDNALLCPGPGAAAPGTMQNYQNFVYDASTDAMYGFLDGDTGLYPYFMRINRTNGSLNYTAYSTYLYTYGQAAFNPSPVVKMYDNAGTADIWCSSFDYTAGSQQYIASFNGSTGAVISTGVSTGFGGYNPSYFPFIKVSNGYGVFNSNYTNAGSLTAFSVSATGAIVMGAQQSAATLGIAGGGSYANTELIPLGNTGKFLYFRSDIGTYGTIYVVTLNTGTLTFTVNNTYALTAAQANYAGRVLSQFTFSPLNAANQIVLYQGNTATAGALTLITYTAGTSSLVISNAVAILSPSGGVVTLPTLGACRYQQGAHSSYDGTYFYFVDSNCHLKIPFTGTAITRSAMLGYTKRNPPLAGDVNAGASAYWNYAPNNTPAGTVYIPMFYPTTGYSGANQTGYFVVAEESLDNTFAYGVEIGIATTTAAKGASVTVAIKNAKLTPPVGAAGTVGTLSSNGASIYVSSTLLYAIGDFDLVYPRLPSPLSSISYASGGSSSTTPADYSLNSNAPIAYKSIKLSGGTTTQGGEAVNTAKVLNNRQSVYRLGLPNWYTGIPAAGSVQANLPLLLSFDGIFIPQNVSATYGGGAAQYWWGSWDRTSYNAINSAANWSVRNEFGAYRYDYQGFPSTFNYQSKD